MIPFSPNIPCQITSTLNMVLCFRPIRTPWAAVVVDQVTSSKHISRWQRHRAVSPWKVPHLRRDINTPTKQPKLDGSRLNFHLYLTYTPSLPSRGHLSSEPKSIHPSLLLSLMESTGHIFYLVPQNSSQNNQPSIRSSLHQSTHVLHSNPLFNEFSVLIADPGLTPNIYVPSISHPPNNPLLH